MFISKKLYKVYCIQAYYCKLFELYTSIQSVKQYDVLCRVYLNISANDRILIY